MGRTGLEQIKVLGAEKCQNLVSEGRDWNFIVSLSPDSSKVSWLNLCQGKVKIILNLREWTQNFKNKLALDC